MVSGLLRPPKRETAVRSSYPVTFLSHCKQGKRDLVSSGKIRVSSLRKNDKQADLRGAEKQGHNKNTINIDEGLSRSFFVNKIINTALKSGLTIDINIIFIIFLSADHFKKVCEKIYL